MKNKVLFGVTALIVLSVAILGIIKKDTYTDILNQPNYLDNISVAVLPEMIAINSCEMAREQLKKAPIVAKVEVVEEEEHLFGTTRQKVYVKKQYVGDSLVEGENIYIYADHWSMSLVAEPISIERSFVNILKVGKDYLIFLTEENKNVKLDAPLYKLYEEPIIAPVFCYEEIENVPVATSGEHTYVEYNKVRECEFFCETEKGIEAWEELKTYMIERYR